MTSDVCSAAVRAAEDEEQPALKCPRPECQPDALDGFTFGRDGFCVLRSVLDAPTVQALRQDVASRGVEGVVWPELPGREDAARTEEQAYRRLRSVEEDSEEQLIATCLFATLLAYR